jgi:hypothetical protein
MRDLDAPPNRQGRDINSVRLILKQSQSIEDSVKRAAQMSKVFPVRSDTSVARVISSGDSCGGFATAPAIVKELSSGRKGVMMT